MKKLSTFVHYLHYFAEFPKRISIDFNTRILSCAAFL